MARTTAERAARPVVRHLVMAAFGGIVMLAALVALVSCASSPKSDPLAEAGRALSDTDSQALHVDGDEAETMRAAVERFIALFQDFEPTTIDERARTVYAEQAYFNDGFIEVRGIDEIAGYLVRSAEAAGEVAIDVRDVAYGGAEIYVRWDMRFSNRSGSKPASQPGRPGHLPPRLLGLLRSARRVRAADVVHSAVRTLQVLDRTRSVVGAGRIEGSIRRRGTLLPENGL
jgi:limonene-1,2-epoxide hydrolase